MIAMADEVISTFGDPDLRGFVKGNIREIRYENHMVQVHTGVIEIYREFLRRISDLYIPIPLGIQGYSTIGTELERLGLSVYFPGIDIRPRNDAGEPIDDTGEKLAPVPVVLAALELGFTVVSETGIGFYVEWRQDALSAEYKTRELIEERTTRDDSIEVSIVEITRPGTRGLALGDTGPDVHFLQLLFLTADQTGVFGRELEGQVKAFQKSRLLPETGVVDERFWLSMFPERVIQVAPNDNGWWVRMVQALIIALDYGSSPITSSYGTRTTRDVRYVQQVNNLRSTGFVRSAEWGVFVHRPVAGFPLG